jgi:hypothetical protein
MILQVVATGSQNNDQPLGCGKSLSAAVPMMAKPRGALQRR